MKGCAVMKRLLLLMLALLFVASFALGGCDDYEKSEKDPTTVAETTKAETITLVGQWEYAEGGYMYTFNEDGTGTYTFSGSEMKFTYEDNGDSFSILYEGNTTATELEYEIKDSTLVVTDSFGSPVEYTRK